MGNPISKAIKEQQAENKEEAVEALQLMHKRMQSKIDSTSAKMESSALEDKSLPIVAVVDKSMKYSIKASSATSEVVGKAISEVLKGDFLSGVTDIITLGLNAMLGNESVGEIEKQDFHVVFANNSLLRIDYMFYKYEFSSKGLINMAQNIFCYYLQVGVLDLEKVDPQILLYELTKAVGEKNLPRASTHLKELNTFAKDLYSAINEMGEAAVSEVEGSPSNQPLAIPAANSMFSPKKNEETRKKATLARYYKQKHACFFAVLDKPKPDTGKTPDHNDLPSGSTAQN